MKQKQNYKYIHKMFPHYYHGLDKVLFLSVIFGNRGHWDILGVMIKIGSFVRSSNKGSKVR